MKTTLFPLTRGGAVIIQLLIKTKINHIFKWNKYFTQPFSLRETILTVVFHFPRVQSEQGKPYDGIQTCGLTVF